MTEARAEAANYRDEVQREALEDPNPLIRGLAKLSSRTGRSGLTADLESALNAPATAELEPAWRPDARIEQLRRYLQSPDYRERAVAMQAASTIQEYEAQLRQFLLDGGVLPAGTVPLQPNRLNNGFGAATDRRW